jgi:hypothetical protein
MQVVGFAVLICVVGVVAAVLPEQQRLAITAGPQVVHA